MPQRRYRRMKQEASTSGSNVRSGSDDSPPHKTLRRAKENELSAARGRFKGALLDAIEYDVEDSDSSVDRAPTKNRYKNDHKSPYDKSNQEEYSSDEEEEEDDSQSEKRKRPRKMKYSKLRNNKSNSFVMKLYDRSVDLAQFTEDTPLYPICRAWMANSPRRQQQHTPVKKKEESNIEDGVTLPPPEGPLVSRVPPLLPEQCAHSKKDMNIKFDNETPIETEQLLKDHLIRWHAIRNKWLKQSVIYESRYAKTQKILTEMESDA